MTLKDHVSGTSLFSYYREGILYYITDTGLEFEVPVSDTGNGSFKASERSLNMMRWIRPQLLKNEQARQECSL